MSEPPEHIAIFCDDSTTKGSDLGATTMPEMRRYSVVGAINLMWLHARSHGLGMGWVSILDAPKLCADLDIPQDWSLIAYLVYRLARSQLDHTRIRNRWLGNPPRGPAHRNPLRSQCSD